MTAQQPISAGAEEPWSPERLNAAIATANHTARRFARRRRLEAFDREDIAQDILVALVQRGRRFDPARGAWSTFAALVARHVVAEYPMPATADPHGSEEVVDPDELGSVDPDPVMGLDWRYCLDTMPADLIALARLVAEHEHLADAQRASGLSSSVFYRRIQDLRLHLICWGLRPRGKGRERLRARGKDRQVDR